MKREEWLAERKTGIGSSDASVILGLNPWKSPLALYAEKLGLVGNSVEETEAMEWGLLLQPLLAEKYEQVTKRAVFLCPLEIIRSSSQDFMTASLDATVCKVSEEKKVGPLEIKTTSLFKAKEWDEEPPLFYQVQLQHQLAVTGYQWGSFAVLIGGQRFVWCDVQRNEAFIAALIEKEAEFWDRIQTRNPPMPDATESTRGILTRLYPQDTGGTIALPPEAVAWDLQRMAALQRMGEAEQQKREAENLLKSCLGSATKGILPGGIVYTWKTSERKGYTVEPTTVRTLRRSTT